MINDLKNIVVSPDVTIFETLDVIDRSGTGVALAVKNDGVLEGIVTDGDIRRAILGGAELSSSVRAYVSRNFTAVEPYVSRTDVLDIMQARHLRHIPIVDASGRLIGLHLLHQLLGHIARPNWAMVMAGGKGTRLRPFTENLPKPMVPVAGRPILERIVLHLVGFGIRRIFLSVNYLSHIIEDHFQDGDRFGCKIEYLREDEPLGTGGALSLLPEIPNEPVLMMNGDLIVQADFNRMLHFHLDGEYHATMALRPYTHEVAFGCAETNGDSLIQLEEKPVLTKLVNAGIYVLSPQAVKQVPENTFFPITQLFKNALTENLPCGAYVMEEDWMDIGQPHQLRKANGWS